MHKGTSQPHSTMRGQPMEGHGHHVLLFLCMLNLPCQTAHRQLKTNGLRIQNLGSNGTRFKSWIFY